MRFFEEGIIIIAILFGISFGIAYTMMYDESENIVIQKVIRIYKR